MFQEQKDTSVQVWGCAISHANPDNSPSPRPYHGSSHIQVANGSHLTINEVGDINPSFKDVYVSSGLFNSLISVGQLVEKIVMSISLVMVVLCKIRCWERYS